MKTIGLIGGMSWESTSTYYSLLNRMARERLGGLHSAKLLLWSFDFAEIEALQAHGDWDGASAAMIKAAQKVEKAGADCLIICTNTMHKMALQVQESIGIPLLHIADATAAAIRSSGSVRPLLLATRYTMEQDFYLGRLADCGVNAIVPDSAGRDEVHKIIYEELCQGIIKKTSKQAYLDIVEKCRQTKGIDSIIFGCTEVGLLISRQDFDLPCFDTTEIHASVAMDFALS